MTEPSGTSVWLALWRARDAMDRVARQSMSDVGLGFSDFATLEALLHLGPLSPSALAEKIGLTSGSMTTALDRLERRGLVVRAVAESDRRGRVVELTAEGRSVIGPAYETHARDIDRVIGQALTAEERLQLFALLRKVQHAAEEGVSS